MLLMNYQGKVIREINGQFSMHDQEIVTSLPGGWSFYTLVSCITRHQCVRSHPREEYITCYLGNILVEGRYELMNYLGQVLYESNIDCGIK